MKSILLKKTKPFILTCSLVCSLVFLYSFTNSNINSPNEYLSIVVDFQYNYQSIYITEKNLKPKKIAITPPERNNKYFSENGYRIVSKTLNSTFDNRYVFEFLQKYEKEGWKLISHNFGVGTSEDGQSQMSFYLFNK